MHDKEQEVARRKLKTRIPASARILGGPHYSHLKFFWAYVQEAGQLPEVWSLRNIKATWQRGHVQLMKAGCPAATQLLLDRIAKFETEGKEVELLKGPYFRSYWYRAQVRVNGRRYGWYMGEWSKGWSTGDDLDKQAAASRIYRQRDKLSTIVLEMPDGRKEAYPVTGDLVWPSFYTSIPISELSHTEFTRVGHGLYRLTYDDVDWGDGSISDEEEMRKAALDHRGRP